MNAEQESITEPDAELIALGSRLEGLLQDYFAAHLEWAPGLDDPASVALLTDDSQIGANLQVCADEENRANFDQRR